MPPATRRRLRRDQHRLSRIRRRRYLRLGHAESVFAARWPDYDPALAADEQIELVVQVNGKVRSRVLAPPGLPEAEAVGLAQADETVRKFIDGKQIRKAIYVKDRLVNLVVGA